MYTRCALRFDVLPIRITGPFPGAGKIMRELPPLLVNRFVVDKVIPGDTEVVCGRVPYMIPTHRYSRVPSLRMYRKVMEGLKHVRKYKMNDTCFFETWYEYEYCQLPWHDFYN